MVIVEGRTGGELRLVAFMKLSSSLDPASLLRDSEHDDVIVDAVNAELREREQHIASVLQLNLVVSEHGAVHRFLDILTEKEEEDASGSIIAR